MKRLAPWLAPLALAAALLSLYLATLSPGVENGDSAELQYVSPILGICHAPGYPFVVIAGKVFGLLSLGGDIAWRVNLLCAVCGVAGCLLVYATVRRLTGKSMPGLIAALTLGFSSVYWTHSVLAEVYTFYGLLLIGSVYGAVRYVQTNRTAWFYAAALLYGGCVANRPSELFVAPAFVFLWWFAGKSVVLRPRTIGIGALLLVAPFVLTLAYYFARENPAYLHARDDAIRDKAVDSAPLFHEKPFGQRLSDAFRYSLGLTWAGRKPPDEQGRFAWDADKYAWLISGAGAFGDRFSPQDRAHWRQRAEQGRGVSIGLPGMLAAVAGVVLWRRKLGTMLLAGWLWIGNLVFYFYHHPPDNLEFILPGLLGLAILVGLAAAGPPVDVAASAGDGPSPPGKKNPPNSPAGSRRKRRRQLPLQHLCWIVPAFLLVGNHPPLLGLAGESRVSQNTTEQRQALEQAAKLAAAPLPPDCFIATGYMRAMTYRYLYHIQARRPDIHVLSIPGYYTPEQRARLFEYLVEREQAVFLRIEDRGWWQGRVEVRTPSSAELARLGFVERPRRP